MRALARTRTLRWPFWLLIAAWVCANSPQAATYALLTWMAEARSFAHQQRLTVSVATLLGGGEQPAALARAETAAPAQPLPAIPRDAVLKKIPLSMERISEVLPPRLRGEQPRDGARPCPDSFRAPPPHGPPRATVA